MIESIHKELMKVAPHVAFFTEKTPDLDAVNTVSQEILTESEKKGLEPFCVIVTAQAIVGGQVINGNSYLHAVFYEPHEDVADVDGYLTGLLEESAMELQSRIADELIVKEIELARIFLKANINIRDPRKELQF